MRKKIASVTKYILRKLTQKSISKALGYERNAKLLIIHADDLGLTRSENEASFKAMDQGMVNSGSVMIPCPEINDVVHYLKMHPNADIGIHLTVTSEWPVYKWRPVSTVDTSSSITDGRGYFYENVSHFSANAHPQEVENEFRAQIGKALNIGIKPTHLDSHMYAAFTNKEILDMYISLGKEFNLPTLLTYELPIRSWFLKDLVVVDRLYCASPNDFDRGLHNYYSDVLERLRPGLNCILIHPAFDNREMQRVTGTQSDFGSAWRQEDYEYFVSDACRTIIKKNDIKLVTWSEIQKKLIIKSDR